MKRVPSWSLTLHSVVLGLVVALLSGCGTRQPAAVAPEEIFPVGTVDSTLPPADQAKQQVVLAVLSAVRDGIKPNYVSRAVPGVTFQETPEKFLDGAVKLIRWKFNGRPQGGAVPVLLTFATVDAPREPDQAQRQVERSYRVANVGGRVTISRQ